MMRIVFIITCLLFFLRSSSQEMLGLVNSNYAGVQSTMINPSSIVNSKLYLDVHLFSLNIFLENNYININKKDFKFLEFFSRDPDLASYGQDSIPFDHYWDQYKKDFYLPARLLGPGFMIINGNHAIALTSSLRAVQSANHIPYHVGDFIYEGLDCSSNYNILFRDRNFNIAMLSWMEVGVTYATVIKRKYRNHWSAGITVKRLWSNGGYYLYDHILDYVMLNDSTADIRNLDATAAFAIPLDYEDNELKELKYNLGRGYSFDLGLTYQKTLKLCNDRQWKTLCSQQYEDYLYKIGVSLLDLGWVRFKKNSQKHLFDHVSHYWEHINLTSFSNINDMMKELSARFYQGDSTASFTADRFTMILPSRISVQADYHYSKYWYFNSTIVYPLFLGKPTVPTFPVFSLTARYERENFVVNIPFSIYNWLYPHFGLSVRYAYFTVGSDNLFGFLNVKDFTGMDIYVSLKFRFNKGNCFSLRGWQGCKGMEFSK